MSAFKRFIPNTYLRFIILFIILYLLFNYFNIFYIGLTAKGGLYSAFLDENLNYIKWWRTFFIESSAKILRWLGHMVITNDTQLKVIGKAGFTLVYSCLGYGIMSVFVAFCISFPNPFKNRLGFTIFGLILIQLLNLARFVLIPLYWNRKWNILPIDHHNLFNLLIYTILILTCYLWIRYSAREGNVKNSA